MVKRLCNQALACCGGIVALANVRSKEGRRVRRREFISILTSGVAVWGLNAHGQQSGKFWHVGFIAHTQEKFYEPLFQRLRELGYEEGRNLVVERRYAQGHAERFQEFADEMVRLNVDVIIVITTPAAQAAKRSTTAIPIVHPAAIDPVGTGLVASLARPGGNVTGLAVLNAELSAKRLEVLHEVIPGLSHGAVLWNAANPANSLAWEETKNAASVLAVTLKSYEVRDVNDFDGAFARIAQQGPDFLYVLQDALTLQNRRRIIDFANQKRLPSMFVGKEWVEEGGLMCYGDNLPERYRRAASYVDKIRRGAKPADLPVEQPTLFELVFNLKTAKAIGITIPPALLSRADEIIE
jgi:putative tryptophan/tyrosine transport system substrate-binding protein